MSNLVELIRKSKKVKKEEVVPTTVRIPMKLNSVMEALADQLSLSKQEMMLHLIEAGLKIAEEELKLDDVEEEKKKQLGDLGKKRQTVIIAMLSSEQKGKVDEIKAAIKLRNDAIK